MYIFHNLNKFIFHLIMALLLSFITHSFSFHVFWFWGDIRQSSGVIPGSVRAVSEDHMGCQDQA